MKPNLASPATTMITPTKIASSEASATARAGSPSASISGAMVAAIIGPEGGVGTEHQHPGRTEDRVADQAQDRGVEPGDRRQAGELGVRHPLRHEEGGQHQPGDDVLGEPLALVVGDQRDAGDQRPPLRRCGGRCSFPLTVCRLGIGRRRGSPATGEAVGPGAEDRHGTASRCRRRGQEQRSLMQLPALALILVAVFVWAVVSRPGAGHLGPDLLRRRRSAAGRRASSCCTWHPTRT